ncbi:MAG: ABC transporter ATP-binding protein [Verrucomicrobia bacterium]|nr:ABC transporter ATP-binding protein [Verrucomicrobiota bacterium]
MNASVDPVITLEHVSRRYGAKVALGDVTLSIPRGGVLGLVGANGAGKTTLIKHILGLLRAQEGRVRIFGFNPVTEQVAVLQRLGYVSEDRDLPPWITVGELLRYIRSFYPAWDPDYAERLRQQLQLVATARIRTLSKGELAKAALLVALAHRPELLVLDEPSSGLDPLVRRELLEAVVRAVAEEGRTVLFSSHLLDEVARVSDRVAMLTAGRLVLHGELDAIMESHRRIVVRLKQSEPAPPRLPGTISLTGGPEEWTVICDGNVDPFIRGLRQDGGEVLEDTDATFEEIFHAYAATPTRT